MEELYQLSLALAKWLQEEYPQLLAFMRFISFFGDEEFFLIALPAIYWSINKQLGRQLGYIFLFSALINNITKNLLRQPRPFWVDPALQRADIEGFGLPSGHMQNVTAVFLLLAAHVRRSWMWLLVILLILLMALSRFYLGVHFPHDILIGFVIGLVIVMLFFVWQSMLSQRYNKQILGRRLLLILAIPLLLGVAYVGLLLAIGPVRADSVWGERLVEAELSGYDDIVASFAGLIGFGVGMLLESSRVRFRADGPVWQRVARYVLGMAVALGIWAGLRVVFPSEFLFVALPLRFVRYLLLLLWVTYLAPWVFVRLRLATADPESEVRVTL